MAKRIPQPMMPSGMTGRLFGWLMARSNRQAYRWTIEQLRAPAPGSIFEIGFGTGHLLAQSLRVLKVKTAAGVDPSPLMLETAKKRLGRFGKKASIALSLGDDSALSPGTAFDAIVALHSFQFWENPNATFRKIHEALSPGGRFILVLRISRAHRRANWIPNPISRGENEIADACRAAEEAGFVVLGMSGISKTSHGIVLGCG